MDEQAPARGGSKPTLLVLSQSLPYPPDTGVNIRTYQLLRELSRSFEVHVCAFSRRAHQPSEDALRAAVASLRADGIEVVVAERIPAERGALARGLHLARSSVTRKPFSYFQMHSAGFAGALAAWLGQHDPDLIHVDGIDLHRWIPELPPRPVALTHHDIESHALDRRAARARGPRRIILKDQARLAREAERSVCSGLALNVVVSEIDAERLASVSPKARIVVVPNGASLPEAPGNEPAAVPDRVAFAGHGYFGPNADALSYLVGEVWPEVRLRRPTAELRVYGKQPETLLRVWSRSPGVRFEGYVDRIEHAISTATCVVAPIRYGGGTRLKILEAWALARPVVSTSLGAEGLAAEDGQNILIRDTPPSIAEAVARILGDPDLARRLGAGGRRTAEQLYSWPDIGRSLSRAYHDLLNAAGPPQATR